MFAAGRTHRSRALRPLASLAALALLGAGAALPAAADDDADPADGVIHLDDEFDGEVPVAQSDNAASAQERDEQDAAGDADASDDGFAPMIADVDGVYLSEVYFRPGNDDDFVEFAADPGTNVGGWTVGSLTRGGGVQGDINAVVTLSDDVVVPENGVLAVDVDITNAFDLGFAASVFILTDDDEIAAFYTIGYCTGGGACDLDSGGATAGSGDSVPEPIWGLTATPTEEVPPSSQSLQWIDGAWTSGTPSPGEPNDGDDPGEPGEPEELEIAEVWGVDNDTLVTTTGVVTAHYPTGGFNGYVIQTSGTGGDTDLDTREVSDALFVFSPSTVDLVEIGQLVEVTGARGVFNGLHQITLNTATTGHGLEILAEDFDDVVPVPEFVLPETDDERLAYQSMLVHPADRYVVSDTYELGGWGETVRYGTIGLGLDRPLVQESELINPITDPTAFDELLAYNEGRAVSLDDGQSAQTPFDADVPYLTGEPNVRTGVGVSFEQPMIFDYRFGWNFQPTGPVTGNGSEWVSFDAGDTRQTNQSPADVGGDVTLAIFNVLNYFTTLGADQSDCWGYDHPPEEVTVAGCNDPDPGPRGAWNQEHLDNQQDKIVAAINELDADVVALSEIENSAHFNDGENRDESLEILVGALNDDAEYDRWDFAPSPQDVPSLEDDDVIRNAFIYQSEAVELGDAAQILVGDGAYYNAREPLAQSFVVPDSDYEFLAVVNHFKSKGCSGYDGDDIGAGCWNGDRVNQAESLVEFADDVAADADIEDVFLVGDFNSYSAEDPLQVFTGEGYSNVNPAWDPRTGAAFDGDNTYVFSGRVGSLDHIFASASAGDRITGTEVWSINANESVLAEYSRVGYFGSTHFDEEIPFRASDHDPVIIGIEVPEPVDPPESVDLSVLSFNDFHGRIGSNDDAVGEPATAVAMACLIEDYRDANDNTLLVSAGDNIGASTFTSFIDQDFPTLDVLNELELDVSALGNHEFDQGQSDLDERVIPHSEFPWIAANIVDEAGNEVYDPYVIVEAGGLDVAFIGAITEDMPRLVTPSGIEDLTFTSMSEAVNRYAEELTASGEADVIIAVVHEGLPTTSLDSRTGTAFGELVDNAHDSISAILSGHTHLQYTHDVDGTWVTQAGQYGEALSVLDLTIDTATGEVTASEAQNVAIEMPGDQECDAADDVRQIVDDARAQADELGSEVIGEATADFNRARNADGGENRGGESVLGALVADAQLWYAQQTNPEVQIAFTNSGGLREDLGGGEITYRDAAGVQPFANTLVSLELTGEQLAEVLEAQWEDDDDGRTFSKLAQSFGFRYLYDPDAEPGERISAMFLNGDVVEAGEYYTVVVNSYMAAGGSNMSTFPQARNIADTGQSDLEAMVEYVREHTPITPDYSQRAVGLSWISDPDATYEPGDEVALDVSSFAFTAGEPVAEEVDTALGGVSTGSFALDATPVDNWDEAGQAQIRATVPDVLTLASNSSGGVGSMAAGVPDSEPAVYAFEITDESTGTLVTIPISVGAAEGAGEPPTDGGPGGQMPVTGANVGWIAVGALVLLALGAVLMIRRRRSGAPSE